jgi:hypothetical protein
MTTNTERDHPWYLAKDEQVPEGMRGVLTAASSTRLRSERSPL